MHTARALYDQIGRGYDDTRRADPHIADRLFHLLNITDDAPVLDVACGTGNYTQALSSQGVEIYGVDLSARMLGSAKRKGIGSRLALGDATQLPYLDGVFQGAICTLATHHFADLLLALSEIHRVLNLGRLVIFTSTPEQMRGYWLNAYFPVSMQDSIEQMPDFSVTFTALHEAGFNRIETEPYEVAPNLQDQFLYSGKHEPERYLDEAFRAGISTFSSLAHANEVKAGCEALRRDIVNGKISDVIKSYVHDVGDYLFVVADKVHI